MLFEIPGKELKCEVKMQILPILCHERVYVTLSNTVMFIFEIHLICLHGQVLYIVLLPVFPVFSLPHLGVCHAVIEIS